MAKREAQIINPFRVDPVEDEEETLDEVESYSGWLPTDDDPEVEDEDLGSVTLDEFHWVINALLNEGKKRKKKKKKKRPKGWPVGGPMSTGPSNPGFGSSGGSGGA